MFAVFKGDLQSKLMTKKSSLTTTIRKIARGEACRLGDKSNYVTQISKGNSLMFCLTVLLLH